MKIKSLNFDEGKRVLYVGDLHGCYDLLMEKLYSLNFNKEEDILVCTGDLIDRGKQNLECLELLNEPWFYSVMGNHEYMAYEALLNPKDKRDLWLSNGGWWYFDYVGTDDLSYLNDLIRCAGALPHILEVNTGAKKVVVCHAGYPTNDYPSDDVSIRDIIWNRERFEEWSDWRTETYITGADLFVFGHTPVTRPTLMANQWYIDTGAVFPDGLLTIKEL